MVALVGSMQQRFFPSRNDNDDTRNQTASHPNDYLGHIPSYEEAMNPQYTRRIPSTNPSLTPYLGPRSRLSQVWFNRWTVLLFLIVVRVLLATQSLDKDLDSAKEKALSACTGVESMGSAMVSMPHYMSKGVNEMAAMGVEAGVRALEKSVTLLITMVQEIVVFVINMIAGTYVCLITLAVKGTAGALVDATKEITDSINNAMKDITENLEGDMKKVQGAFNKFLEGASKVPSFFGSDVETPKIELPSMDKLKNVKIPTDFVKKMEEMEKGIPDFKEVKDKASDVIRIPFKKINQLVNGSLSTYQFDRSIFPTPAKEKLTFCSDNPSINNFFDNLKRLVVKVKNILVGVLVALAILVMAPMAYREIRMWRTLRARAYMLSDPHRQFDPVDVVHVAMRPHSSAAGLKLASRFKSGRRQILVRWAVAYVTSPPALFVLALGVAGLLGVLCQYILLKQVEAKAPELAAEIGEFAGMVVDKLTNASQAWAVSTNEALNTTNAELNKDLFGWVKEGTDSLNDTLTMFVDTMSDSLDAFFGDSPLKGPIKDVLDCLITFKVQGIQKGLTWVHDNAKVTLPTLPKETFSLGALDSIGPEADGAQSFLSNPDSAAADQITDVIVKLTQKWEAMIYEEAVISTCITLIWVIVLLIAVTRTLVLFWGRDKNHGEGGEAPAHYNSNENPFADAFTPPKSPGWPAFAPSPVDERSPQLEFVNEKRDQSVQLGVVRSGTSSVSSSNRQSVYPEKIDYRC